MENSSSLHTMVTAMVASTKMSAKALRAKVLVHEIQEGKIPVTEALADILHTINRPADLYVLSLLYSRLDTPDLYNIYLPAPEYGEVHILIYVFLFTPESLKSYVYVFLLLLNSSAWRRPFASKLALPGSSVIPDVATWLGNEGFMSQGLPRTATEARIYLSEQETVASEVIRIILGITSRSTAEYESIFVLCDHPGVIDSFKEPSMGATPLFRQAFEALDQNIIKSLLEQGHLPTYIDLCFWISIYRGIVGYRCLGLTHLAREFIILALSHGAEYDRYQHEFLLEIDPDNTFRTNLQRAYEQPDWLKLTQAQAGPIPPQLEWQLAMLKYPALPRSHLREYLFQVSQADPEAVIESYENQNRIHLLSSITPVVNFIGLDINRSINRSIPVVNREALPSSPLQVLDIHWVAAQDLEGVYILLSSYFPRIVKDRVNPFTSRPLSSLVVMEVEKKLAMLEMWHHSPHNLTTIGELLETLQRVPRINSLTTDQLNSQVIQQAIAYLRQDSDNPLANMVLNELKRRFKTMGVELKNVIPIGTKMPDQTIKQHDAFLSFELQLAMVCRTIDQANRANHPDLTAFFQDPGI